MLLGPVAARNPDVAMALLAGADEAVAAGRARWRRCASLLVAGRARS